MRRWAWLGAGLILLLVIGGLAARTPDLTVLEARAKYATPASRFVVVAPGLAIHVRDEGPPGAPVLLLIHGSNASLQTWEPWVARLKDRYRVVTLDLPGHGLTGADPRRDYSTVAYVRVVEQVAAARGLTRFAIGGNSMGGWVAWTYAATHPAQIAGLILIDAAHPVAGEPSGETPWPIRLATIPGVRSVVEQITPRWLIAASLKPAVFDPEVMSDAMIDRYWELLRYPGNRAATLDRFAQPNDPAAPAALHPLDLPMLVLWGREDRFIPVAAADWFRTRGPRGRVVILDRVGHVPMEEAPDRALAPVLEFLAQTAGAPRSAPR